MEKYVDLHLHSRHSDGTFTPAELVAMAEQKGLKAIALADHDSVAGIDEAIESGRKSGIEIIPAVELSAEYKRFRDIHVLGYFIDHTDDSFLKQLEEFRETRDNRGKLIVERINRRLARQNKGSISLEQVLALSEGALGRPHIARVLVTKGYAANTEDAFVRYLIPCDVSKRYFPITDAIREIRRIGGISVLAHPGSITPDRPALRKLITELAGLGLDGIEVFNNMCFGDDMIFFESIANDLGLVMTGGSDFHGFESDVEIGSGRGGLSVAYRLVEKMRERTDRSRILNG